ncbi:HNH endonuclease [Fulvivirga sp.]|uniref:HNH endonuclease n=1 Tax=Fulvivirga sp. TaxID=1931237 RepID=UPI0032EBFAC8
MDSKSLILLILISLVAVLKWLFDRLIFIIKRNRRRNYYRNVYLQSDDWKRKRYVVLKRDNWTCVYCGSKATQVHHKKYAKRNIGKEPIKWLVSVCDSCHEKLHS